LKTKFKKVWRQIAPPCLMHIAEKLWAEQTYAYL